jgi:hypothetical protein
MLHEYWPTLIVLVVSSKQKLGTNKESIQVADYWKLDWFTTLPIKSSFNQSSAKQNSVSHDFHMQLLHILIHVNKVVWSLSY